jgi:hypothetical protein
MADMRIAKRDKRDKYGCRFFIRIAPRCLKTRPVRNVTIQFFGETDGRRTVATKEVLIYSIENSPAALAQSVLL